MISAFAEFERAIIHERVIAGMEKAKLRVAKIGGLEMSPVSNQKIIMLKERGLKYKEIIKQVEVSKGAYRF